MTPKASIALSCSFTIGLICACPHNAQAIASLAPTSASDPCSDSGNSIFNFCSSGVDDTVNTTMQYHNNQQSSGQDKDHSASTVDDQRAQQTAEGSASSDARAAGTRYVCDGVTREYSLPDGTAKKLGCLFSSARSGDDTAGVVPTTSEILYYAATTIHADGAGLYKRPLGVSYTNKFIPTIVAVTSPTQTHVINLLGRDITITLTATNYEWSWGDGTQNLVTTSTGSVWSEGMDLNTDPRLIRHYYTPPQGWRSGFDGPYPHENREITLTTTWSGTATNPFTGETQTINGLVTTTETTGQFPLSHLVINNTDTWEEKQGH